LHSCINAFLLYYLQGDALQVAGFWVVVSVPLHVDAPRCHGLLLASPAFRLLASKYSEYVAAILEVKYA
jgi:hypothetical protein